MAGKSRSRAVEAKRLRRARRLEKRHARETPSDSIAVEHLLDVLEALEIPDPPEWPGAADGTVARPDRIKLELSAFAMSRAPERSLLRWMEQKLASGPLGEIDDIDHWAIEEFLWHGAPGHAANPLDSFLAKEERRFAPAAREQLGRWKEAKIGAFEVGRVRESTLTLRPWDVLAGVPTGPAFEAISLSIGGVNAYRGLQGAITATYVAPWAPELGLFAAMGYGVTVPKREAVPLSLLLELSDPAAAVRAFPWKESRVSWRQHVACWREREWYGWLEERLEFPTKFVATITPDGMPQLLEAQGLSESTAEQARELGIYLECRKHGEHFLVGAGNARPIESRSRSAKALFEYSAWRRHAGLPPGVRDLPPFMTFNAGELEL